MYTGLRLALLAAVWLLIQVVTPMRGLLAVAVALVISGIVSFVLLDRPRDQASAGLSGLFRRIDDRIERSRVAEDVDIDAPALPSGEGEAQPEQEAVGEHDESAGLQHRHERATGGAGRHGDDGSHSEGRGDDTEPRESQAETSR